ncbi:hypothetical protein [Lactococcus ileimucosae]|uniref:hypothetical protein n=1 Tax=Lactococcus ileimucosae TaxID=2941329 RepID=UPI003511896C
MSKLTDHITNMIGKIVDAHDVVESKDVVTYSHKVSPVAVIEILEDIRALAEEEEG